MRSCSFLLLLMFTAQGWGQNVSLNFLGRDRIGYSRVDAVHDAEIFVLDKDLKKKDMFITTPVIYHSNFSPVPLVVFPQDTLDISFTNKQVLIVSRNNPTRNYEQLCTKQIADEYGELVFMNPRSADNVPLPDIKKEFAKQDKKYFAQTGEHLKKPTRSLAERDSLLYRVFKGRQAIINSYHKKYGLSPEYLHFMQGVILYRYLYFSILGYKLLNDPQLSDNLRKYISDPSLQNDSNVVNINMYRAFFLTLNRYQTQIAKGLNASPLDEIGMASESLSGKTRENVIMTITYNELQKKKAGEELLSAFYQYCSDTTYINKINGMALLFDRTSAQTGNMLVGLAQQKRTFDDMLKARSGKIVVVDFWASWCGPCIKEFPSYRKLIPKLNGKPVEFVFLSLDDDAGNWRRSAAGYKDLMDEKNSFVIVNGKTAALAKKYSISTIPRIIIFNQRGEAAYLDAPRASDPALLSILLNEVKKL